MGIRRGVGFASLAVAFVWAVPAGEGSALGVATLVTNPEYYPGFPVPTVHPDLNKPDFHQTYTALGLPGSDITILGEANGKLSITDPLVVIVNGEITTGTPNCRTPAVGEARCRYVRHITVETGAGDDQITFDMDRVNDDWGDSGPRGAVHCGPGVDRVTISGTASVVAFVDCETVVRA